MSNLQLLKPRWSRTAMMTARLGLTIMGLAASGRLAAAPDSATASRSEGIVYSRTKDDVVNCGVMCTPANAPTNTIALIWVHGWGVNFYQPSYVAIGRALAARGYPCVTVNTRMHDIGFNLGEKGGRRTRGGGYWGITSDQVLDIGAWIDWLEERGHKRVVLLGHSAGWAAVRLYQARTQDPRVVGVVLASGAVRPDTQKPDPALVEEATRLVADGKGDDLLRLPNRRQPSFVGAAAYLDIATNYPPEQRDFFGVQTLHPDVARVRCPLLAFFGSREPDVGTQKDLELIQSSLRKQATGPSRVETAMISGADHMYVGHEVDVAQLLAGWMGKL